MEGKKAVFKLLIKEFHESDFPERKLTVNCIPEIWNIKYFSFSMNFKASTFANAHEISDHEHLE